MAIQVRVFHSLPKAPKAHPYAEAVVEPGYKVIGGGAIDSWSGAGNLLTASYPSEDLRKWIAAGKDHEISSPAVITAYAIAIYDPNNEWDVRRFPSAPSNPAAHPTAVASIDSTVGYILTGGGAIVKWKEAGNLLTASFPSSDVSWEARSKDHDISSPASITAYAIGLKHRKNAVRPERKAPPPVTGKTAAHPTASICLGSNWILTGGGAVDNWSGAGNLLTASYPDPLKPSCWKAAGKDHMHSSPASITVYAIGIRQA
jgi:hypothetical protein